MRPRRRHQRGAVLAETAIAVMPLLLTFFCFVQVGRLTTAGIVVKHAAIVGARAAAVITDPAEVRAGVDAALGPWRPRMDKVAVDIANHANCSDPYGPVTVRVSVAYKCDVPLGKLICATHGGGYPLSHAFTMPAQRARYAGALAHCGAR